MKEIYVPVEMEIVAFEAEDVIRTSVALQDNETPFAPFNKTDA